MTTLARTILLFAAGALAGCGPYTLKGRVIHGETSFVAVVDQDDHRLADGSPVEGAFIKFSLDPGRLNRRVMAQETSAGDGSFSLPIDEFGAGITQLEGGLLARRKGYKSAEGVFRVPNDKTRRLLVVLAPGRDAPGEFEEEPTTDDLLRQFGR